MLRIVTAISLATIFFTFGFTRLAHLRSQEDAPHKLVIFDNEPVCDYTNYLNIGSSEDTIEALTNNIKAQQINDPDFVITDEFRTINEGETLHSILRHEKVSELEIAKLSLALKPYLWAKDLAAGDYYRFTLKPSDNDNLVEQLIIRKLDPHRLPILYRASRTNDDVNDPVFNVTVKEAKITEEFAVIKVTVNGTLYASFNALPFGNELMQKLMAVFPWHLRMPQDVLEDDEIELLVIKKFALSEFIGYGKIKSAYYRQKHQTLFATYFESNDKKIKGFFDENGASLEKEFAYSPVYETTATSNQKWRLHPIRKVRIRHNGVDYRGSIGTDFFSIADGEVVEKRYDKNVGNMIRIKHKYGVYSEYFHADSLVAEIDVGSMVKRGQKIGTIGRTGRLCTGPHLHMGLYRLKGEKRKFIELSSLKSTLRPVPNIALDYLPEFQGHVKKLVALMQDLSQKPLVAESID